MIRISEHNFKNENYNVLSDKDCQVLGNGTHSCSFIRKRSNEVCYKISHFEGNKYRIESSYIIGVGWVVEKEIPIFIEPKLNTETNEIDYFEMLFEALNEPENFNHLSDLYTIDFKAPQIPITQKEDLLTPLLLLEFLVLLNQIVSKGLKKSYYKVTNNLNARVKGKILINSTVKRNHIRHKMSYNICQYDEFGYNSMENRILKMALIYSESMLYKLNNKKFNKLESIFNFIKPAFAKVDGDIDVKRIKDFKSNIMFKEYDQALKVAQLILKKCGYNISKTIEKEFKTPPFWIDMTKLFELYVFKQLKNLFPLKGEVKYHKKIHYQEPDFILKSRDGTHKMVIDAKYKPKYENEDIKKDDARQVSGYARMFSMYNELEIVDLTKIIDALIIYSSQNKPDILTIDRLNEEKSSIYVQFYKVGVKLPVVE